MILRHTSESRAAPASPPVQHDLDARAAVEAPVGAPAEDFARLLVGMGHEIERGEALVGQALAASRAGHPFAPAELIALQAGVYRYAEAVDLASRLVDRSTSGIKTVLQG